MLDYKEFISHSHSLLIAPAGFGKTHTISECLKVTIGKQLILTHTHAGVASIREKVRKAGIPSSSYGIETITSFAQRYVLAFYTENDVPQQENSKEYYPFIIEKATLLFRIKPITKIVLSTFSGLFVDEYQDCSLEQHEMIIALSKLFPTRILGDYLQGIFEFNSASLVNLQSPDDLGDFGQNRYDLEVPWRWKIGGNELLGQELKTIRSMLKKREVIDLSKFRSFEVNVVDDIYRGSSYGKVFDVLNSEESLLIITPNSSYIHSRLNFIKKFKNLCLLMESIDNKDFYQLSHKCDSITEVNAFEVIRELALKLFNKTGIDKWFNEKGLKRKRDALEKASSDVIHLKIGSLSERISNATVSKVLKDIKNLPGVKCYRKELLASLCRVLEESEIEDISVYEAMLNKRNMIRRMGRKVYGKCVGTTLLTKGLEFDAVLIVDAHKFDCPKNLYVALTRASKRLVVFTKHINLNPYT